MNYGCGIIWTKSLSKGILFLMTLSPNNLVILQRILHMISCQMKWICLKAHTASLLSTLTMGQLVLVTRYTVGSFWRLNVIWCCACSSEYFGYCSCHFLPNKVIIFTIICTGIINISVFYYLSLLSYIIFSLILRSSSDTFSGLPSNEMFHNNFFLIVWYRLELVRSCGFLRFTASPHLLYKTVFSAFFGELSEVRYSSQITLKVGSFLQLTFP